MSVRAGRARHHASNNDLVPAVDQKQPAVESELVLVQNDVQLTQAQLDAQREQLAALSAMQGKRLSAKTVTAYVSKEVAFLSWLVDNAGGDRILSQECKEMLATKAGKKALRGMLADNAKLLAKHKSTTPLINFSNITTEIVGRWFTTLRRRKPDANGSLTASASTVEGARSALR